MVSVIRLVKSQITVNGLPCVSRKWLIVIIRLMLSPYLGPKVITLSGFHCIRISQGKNLLKILLFLKLRPWSRHSIEPRIVTKIPKDTIFMFCTTYLFFHGETLKIPNKCFIVIIINKCLTFSLYHKLSILNVDYHKKEKKSKFFCYKLINSFKFDFHGKSDERFML